LFLQKADKRALANKVSRTDFDHTTGEMGKNIDDLLKKILNQVMPVTLLET